MNNNFKYPLQLRIVTRKDEKGKDHEEETLQWTNPFGVEIKACCCSCANNRITSEHGHAERICKHHERKTNRTFLCEDWEPTATMKKVPKQEKGSVKHPMYVRFLVAVVTAARKELESIEDESQRKIREKELEKYSSPQNVRCMFEAKYGRSPYMNDEQVSCIS